MEGLLILFFVVYCVALCTPLIAVYIVNSLALMKVARRLGHPHPAYAFIPVYSSYMQGKLFENASARNGVAPRKYAKVLLSTEIILVLSLLIILSFFGFMFGSILGNFSDEIDDAVHIAEGSLFADDFVNVEESFDYAFENIDDILVSSILGFSVSMVIAYPVMIAASIVSSIFLGLGWWQLYRCFDEQHALLYLLLSLFVGIPFVFYFIISGREPKPEGGPVNTETEIQFTAD